MRNFWNFKIKDYIIHNYLHCYRETLGVIKNPDIPSGLWFLRLLVTWVTRGSSKVGGSNLYVGTITLYQRYFKGSVRGDLRNSYREDSHRELWFYYNFSISNSSYLMYLSDNTPSKLLLMETSRNSYPL